ncbi:MAG: PH domain-containing protein [Gaiellaceae bacterium]
MPTDDEQVFLDARRHGVVLARPLGQALLLAVIGGTLTALVWPLAVAGAILVALAAVMAVRAVWGWERLRLVVTGERLYVVEGTIRKRARQIRLGRIDAVEVEQSAAGRMLGYGTLLVGPLEIEHVPKPREVTELVERLAS